MEAVVGLLCDGSRPCDVRETKERAIGAAAAGRKKGFGMGGWVEGNGKRWRDSGLVGGEEKISNERQ